MPNAWPHHMSMREREFRYNSVGGKTPTVTWTQHEREALDSAIKALEEFTL